MIYWLTFLVDLNKIFKSRKMKKGKAKEKKSRVIVAEKYEDDGETSDDEMPEVVSNAAMKDNHDVVLKQLEHMKQQLRQAEKAKRRQKQELFIAQKKVYILYN